MTKLSAVIITFNEERNIGRCLASLEGVADEIVVVDSLSSDNTREICESFEVKFFTEKWQGYSGQKNLANSLTVNDWVLSVDADEAVSEELKLSILKWKSSEKPGFARFNRLTNYGGQWIRHCGWYPDTKLRIFNKEQAYWKGDVHEELKFDNSTKVEFLKGDLLHYSYYSVDEHVAQTNKFSTLAAQELVKKGKKISLFKIIVSPAAKFLRKYFLNLGFLDGYYGYFICRMAALQTFLKYFKARQMQLQQKQTSRS